MTPATVAGGCPNCGRPGDPEAAEVVRLDAELPRLTAVVEVAQAGVSEARQESLRAQQRVAELQHVATRAVQELIAAQQRHATLVASVRARVAAGRHAPAAGRPAPIWAGQESPDTADQQTPGSVDVPAGAGTSTAPAAVSTARPREASARTMQNVLFALGGLLLGVGAIVFTLVAWADLGIGARAAILGGFTLVTLGIPLLATWRGLTATAETFAIIGLFLVILDGYAVWATDLAGVQRLEPYGYAALALLTTVGVALGYRALGRLTRRPLLAGPRFVALLAVQPVIPLLGAYLGESAALGAAIYAGVALLNAAVAWRRRESSGAGLGLRVLAWLGFGLAMLVAGPFALSALAEADDLRAALVAAAATWFAAAVFVLPGVISGERTVLSVLLSISSFVAVAAVVLVGARAVPDYPVGAVAVVVATIAVAVSFVRAEWRTGLLVGAYAWLALGVAGALILALLAQFTVLEGWDELLGHGPVASTWHTTLEPGELIVVFLALAVAGAWVVPGRARPFVAVAALLPLAVVVPIDLGLPWWSFPVSDAAVVVPLVLVATRVARPVAAQILAALATPLTLHAVIFSLWRPAGAAATLAGVVALGAATALLARDDRRWLGGLGTLAALLALPGAVAATAATTGAGGPWTLRLAMAAVVVALAAAFAVARWLPWSTWYAVAAVGLATIMVSFVARNVDTGEPAEVYGALGAIVLAAAALLVLSQLIELRAGGFGAGLAITVKAAFTALFVTLWAVYAEPWLWLGAVWDGAPPGVGLRPPGWSFGELPLVGSPGGGVRIATLLLLLAALAVAGTGRGWVVVRRDKDVLLGRAAPDQAGPESEGWPSGRPRRPDRRWPGRCAAR
ncbi:hypothetical protein ACFQX7_15510 [Luedemannella flava]